MEHRSFTVFFHCSLSWACRSIWVHFRPICRSLCSADLLQLFFGITRFRLPWGFQKSACLVTLLCGFLNVWPIHFHFFLQIWAVIFSPGYLLVGLRYSWCSAILRQGCYVGNDLCGYHFNPVLLFHFRFVSLRNITWHLLTCFRFASRFVSKICNAGSFIFPGSLTVL